MQKEFYLNQGDYAVRAIVSKGKIYSVTYWEKGSGVGVHTASPGNRNFNNCLNIVFNQLCKHDVKQFKKLLRSIKETDYYSFSIGKSLLERRGHKL